MVKKLLSLAVLLALAAGLYYVFAAKSVPPSAPVPLRVVVASDGILELFSHVMKHEGIDTAYGLEVEFVRKTPSDIEREVLEGGFSGVNLVSPLTAPTAAAAGRKTVIISPAVRMAYFIAVRNDSPVQTLDDLKGKRVGVLPKVTAAYSSIALILESAGLSPESDFKLSFGTIPSMVESLTKGEVDAAAVIYPTAAALFASGNFRSVSDLEALWENREEGLSHPFLVWVAQSRWLDDSANRDAARRYVEAFLETAQAIESRPELLTDALNPELQEFLTRLNLTAPAAQELLRENTGGFFYTSAGEREYRAIERVLLRAKERGLLPLDAPLDVVIRPEDL